tara:strand:+ start:398 stop:532 length:135 start_codon:yes stop_codon:yes gene_type:complete
MLGGSLEKVAHDPSKEELHPIVMSLLDLLPPDQQPIGDSSVLVG